MLDVGFSRPSSATPSPSSASPSQRNHTTNTNTNNIDVTKEKEPEDKMPVGLSTLPYDLLLNIATYLDLRDVHALHLTCKSLYDASTTRPVYRKLANDLLRRCRALPLKGFQRLSDLSTESLIHSVNKATHYEVAWRTRAPRPISSEPITDGINTHSNYMDVSPTGKLAEKVKKEGGHRWYKIVSAPPGEEVDWLSPITSSYTLCATKSGKVVCWDVQSDMCLAEWNPGAKWELWKCRVEFEERTVFFTMAKVLSGAYDDDRIMEFVLMKLTFFDGPSGESSPLRPEFSHVTDFRTTGVVMNVFLLDPSERLLSAFIWVSTSNTIGLYALPDWSKREYVFIDTGIECVMSSNWSCILYQNHIVIHCEESDAAYQHFYPLSLLRTFTTALPPETDPTSTSDKGKANRKRAHSTPTPVISRSVPPVRTLKKKFVFPVVVHESDQEDESDDEDGAEMNMASVIINGAVTANSSNIPILNGNGSATAGLSSLQTSTSTSTSSPPSSSSESSSSSTPSTSTVSSSSASTSSTTSSLLLPLPPTPTPNPFPFPPWYPESAHFVRQWWPSLPNIPRVSCTVVLLAAHDQQSHRTRFVLAQHYFRVPLDHREWWCLDGEAESEYAPTEGTKDKGKANGAVNGHAEHQPEPQRTSTPSFSSSEEESRDDALMHLWYISKPFEVVRVFDDPEEGAEDDGDAEAQMSERPRPLVAVDFGHAVWIEYVNHDGEGVSDIERSRRAQAAANHGHHGGGDHYSPGEGEEGDGDGEGRHPDTTSYSDDDPKCLKFVTFPPFSEEYGVELPPSSSSQSDSLENGDGCHTKNGRRRAGTSPFEGEVRTLETPPELDLGTVETINIDQSQGAVILSDKGGRIFILCYE